MVLKAAALYKSEGCDGLIAVGGGSSIDLAKGVAIAATHPGALTEYATIEGGSNKITAQAAPLIAVPTTAGTGSEVARGAIIILDDGRKLGFHSWHLLPKSAICDPELTFGLPPVLTAATGMDAIAHRNSPRAGVQSARRRHRARWSRTRMGAHRTGNA
jgi:4-hydroxybutyrate dehydrogenase